MYESYNQHLPTPYFSSTLLTAPATVTTALSSPSVLAPTHSGVCALADASMCNSLLVVSADSPLTPIRCLPHRKLPYIPPDSLYPLLCLLFPPCNLPLMCFYLFIMINVYLPQFTCRLSMRARILSLHCYIPRI